MDRKWGIYNGFNPHSNPLNKWNEPLCTKCKSELMPWIDWWSNGSIGYCQKCIELSIVKSVWIPSPHAPLRAEINELIKHNIYPVNTTKLTINLCQIWNFHENIPIGNSQVRLLTKLINVLDQSEESKIITHLIWSLIFNSKSLNESLINSYIEFVFKNPHYLKTSTGLEIWIGHELDIVQQIEKSHKKELVKCLYEFWSRNKSAYSNYDFKSRIGFYAPVDDSMSVIFGNDFLEFTTSIKQRIETEYSFR